MQTFPPACKTGFKIVPSGALERITVTNQIPSEEPSKVLDSAVRLPDMHGLESDRSQDIAFTLSRPAVVAHSLIDWDMTGWRIV